MRSIRRSLIVYFLLLLFGTLVAVGYFVHWTSERTLNERAEEAERYIKKVYDANRRAASEEFDRTLVRRATTLSKLMRVDPKHFEFMWPLGAVTAFDTSVGYASALLYSVEGMDYWRFQTGFGQRSPGIAMLLIDLENNRIDLDQSAQEIFSECFNREGKEFFQTYRATGNELMRSASLSDFNLELSAATKQEAKQPLVTVFEDVNSPGGKVRLVTIYLNVERRLGMGLIPAFVPPRPSGKGGGKAGGPPPGPPPGQPPGGPNFASFFPGPPLYVQYAIEYSVLEEKTRSFESERNDAIHRLHEDTEQSLAALRYRLVLIALISLTAVAIGGITIIRLGLAPLKKVSDAVSRVSPKDFRLPIEQENLPDELQPIVQRLKQTLQQLEVAFVREKHAAADISHDLRTPVAALLTTLEMGLRKQRTTEEYRQILEDCQATGLHMNALIERLLRLARLDAGADHYQPRPVDAAEVALQCLDTVRPLAQAHKLKLGADLDAPIWVAADPDKLREVLSNLLHNAVAYNRANGRIDLIASQNNGHAHFEVRDTGIGIKPDAMPFIFERFYRADPSRHSDAPHAGLGLAIVKSYLEQMGSQIRVQSTEAGTTFQFELPSTPDPNPE